MRNQVFRLVITAAATAVLVVTAGPAATYAATNDRTPVPISVVLS